MSCPWNSTSPFKHCEAELCAWIVQPGNTWTNIAYLLVAVYIYRLRTPESRTDNQLYVVSSVLLFFGSTLFHATGTIWGSILDIYAMLVFSMLFLVSGLKRTFGWNNKKTLAFYIGGLAFSFTYPLYLSTGKIFFGLEILAAALLEISLHRKKSSQALQTRWFGWALGTFGVALICFVLDVNRIVCDPDNHILPLHGVWHFLCAVAIGCMYRATTAKSEPRLL